MDRRNTQERSMYLSLEHSTVPQWVQKKAEIELHETEEMRAESLKKLKKKLKDEKNLKANMDDKFLLRFLRARKFDWNRAFVLLKAYYNHRVKYPEVYENCTAEAMKHMSESNVLTYLPFRTVYGSPIMISFFGEWNPEEHPFQDTLRMGLLSLEQVVRNPISQICGVVNIIDLTGFSWKHMSHISLRDIQSFISGVQDTFPLRQKETHIVNNPAAFSMLYFLIKPLLSHKIKKRIYFHGSRMDSLHKHIPPAILPEELDGELGPIKSQEFYQLLTENSSNLKTNQSYGYVQRMKSCDFGSC